VGKIHEDGEDGNGAVVIIVVKLRRKIESRDETKKFNIFIFSIMDDSTNKQNLSTLLGSDDSISPNNQSSIFSSWAFWFIIVLLTAFFSLTLYNYLAKGNQGSININNAWDQIKQSVTKLFKHDSDKPTDDKSDVPDTATVAQNATPSAIPSQVQQNQEPSPTAAKIGGSTTLPGQAPASAPAPATTSPANEPPNMDRNTLNKALNNAQQHEQDYYADDSYSSIQKTKSGNKSGWCYIGEDRGFRSCISVGEADTCMTGDIFPTQDICINPTLRM